MKVLKLNCLNFRNIENTEIVPCDEMNVIYGENAQGKTNLLEAIWLFTGAKSFRNSKDSAFIKFGCKKAVCNLNFISNQIENEATIEIKEKRTAFINQKKLKSISLLAGHFKAIIFSPTDLSIVNEGPSSRRKFIDIAIGQIYPSYISILKNYMRAVVQRNSIIKELKYDSTVSVMLDVFENEIAANGEKLIAFRNRYINIINEFLPNIYEGFTSGKEILETYYICNKKEDSLLESLIRSRKEDMFSGVTSVGPHRDDLDFKINGISVRNFGSQGQKRSVALSLKLAEAEVINKISGEYPVFLLDDVMSELDPERQNFVLNHINGLQSFLTCCDPDTIKNLKKGKKFEIQNGRKVD